MFLFTVTLSLCLQGVVLSALECTDWQGKAVSDGVAYYPNTNDACLLCRCDKGFKTMCQSVSCAPPTCLTWKQRKGECCKFECLDNNGVAIAPENSTIPPSGGDVAGTPRDNTVTDLGLRLVASTVTTFLVLALLLFLIHRFRQRRLLMTLRRYNRRREPLDDLDSISYTPDFYGLQCPPYEDPPPPYTPPKPQPGEEPPPYEAVERNPEEPRNGGHNGSNFTPLNCDQNFNNASANNDRILHSQNGNTHSGAIHSAIFGNGNFEVNGNSNVGINRTIGTRTEISPQSRHNNARSNLIENIAQQQSARNNRAVESATVADRNFISVHFMNNPVGQPSITMGVQNRNRNSRNRYSDGNFNLSPIRNVANRNTTSLNDTTAALNLELQNTIRNFRNRNIQTNSNRNSVQNPCDLSSSTTDIGESTTSAESLSSSPESPNFETESRNDEQLAHTETKHTEQLPPDLSADDANATVKRFLDRQFGLVAKNRRYPTTMSQSWTSAQISPPGQNFRQSISCGSFPPKPESHLVHKSASMAPALNPINRNLSRSKSEHLKTNGSLINQPYKGVVKSPSRNLPRVGHAVRVAYKEPDELCHKQSRNRNSCDLNFHSSTSSQDNVPDSTASICSGLVGSGSTRLTAAMLDPGDIIVTRRQDELRKLRLSHLLNKQSFSIDEAHLDPSSHICSNPRQLQRSLSENSVNSTSVCSETGERHGADVAISNDAPYPTNSYKNFLQSCLVNRNVSAVNSSNPQLPSSQSQGSRSNTVAREQTAGSSTSDASSCKSSPNRVSTKPNSRRKLPAVSMIHSWHCGQVDSCDDNISIGRCSMNTLVRNVNGNFDKKTCMDKDVSNMFFPYYKPTNIDVDIDRDSVPSSEMRACASQLYNYETEERQGKKDKKRHLFKRHSSGCIPVANGTGDSKLHSPRTVQKQYQRLKSSRSHERQSAQRQPENITKDSSRKRVSSRDRKSSKRLLNIGRESTPKVTDLTPSYLLQSHISPERPKSLNVHSERSDLRNSHSLRKGERTRSKSLGRSDLVSATPRNAGRSSQPRKKKHAERQSMPATDSFHLELEHVLQNQKSPIKSPPSQTGCPSNGLDRSQCAITQV